MRMTTFKKVLLTMMGLGVVSSLVSVGTFGFFQATTTNNANTFTAGTLLMTNSSNAGSCTAVSSGSSCNTLSGLNITTPGTLKPSSSATGTVTISSAGSITPSSVKLLFANLTSTANSTAAQCDGSCTGLNGILNITVHDDTTNTCLYGDVSATAVGTNPAKANGACDSIAAATSQGADTRLSSLPTVAANSITIPGTAGSSGCTTAAACLAWTATESHAFTVTIQFPDSGANQNTFQGGKSSFDATWTAAQ